MPRSWKRLIPTSLSHAMELCLQHAKEKHNRSVDQVADLMGIPNKWNIYKWVESGRLPAVLIRPFEHACGIDFVTRYLAHSDHKLLIDIPTGRRAAHREVNDLMGAAHEAVGLLLKFHEGQANANDTIGAITGVMESLGWHRGNVEKSAQPEFEFEEEED